MRTFETFSSSNISFESAEDSTKRAIISIPLMHVGPNNKNFIWKEEVLKEIAPKFRGIPFRFDLDGKTGSSHGDKKDLENMLSPYFDVGWTYKDDRGAWFDEKSGVFWVKGEVTHPDVVSKLSRATSDGSREINFGSMGVLFEPTDLKCSICGKTYGACGHERGKDYKGKVCGAYLPDAELIKKTLPIALTNLPGDTEAKIADVILQEDLIGDTPKVSREKENLANKKNEEGMDKPDKVQTAECAQAPSIKDANEAILDRLGALEEKVNKMVKCPKCGYDLEKKEAVEKQTADSPTPAPEPSEKTPETSMSQGSAEKVSKEKQDDEGKKLNEVKMNKPDMVATADTANRDKLLGEVADLGLSTGRWKTASTAITELADLSLDGLKAVKIALGGIQKPKERLETADNIPEFGGAQPQLTGTAREFADMSADDRVKSFGTFGAFDGCFNPDRVEQWRKR